MSSFKLATAAAVCGSRRGAVANKSSRYNTAKATVDNACQELASGNQSPTILKRINTFAKITGKTPEQLAAQKYVKNDGFWVRQRTRKQRKHRKQTRKQK